LATAKGMDGGFRHAATMSIAVCGFLISERGAFPPQHQLSKFSSRNLPFPKVIDRYPGKPNHGDEHARTERDACKFKCAGKQQQQGRLPALQLRQIESMALQVGKPNDHVPVVDRKRHDHRQADPSTESAPTRGRQARSFPAARWLPEGPAAENAAAAGDFTMHVGRQLQGTFDEVVIQPVPCHRVASTPDLVHIVVHPSDHVVPGAASERAVVRALRSLRPMLVAQRLLPSAGTHCVPRLLRSL
jgi:hypothetical protein